MSGDPAVDDWRRAHAEHLAKPGAIEELARAQGVGPVTRLDELAADPPLTEQESAEFDAALASRYGSDAERQRQRAGERERIAAGIEAMAAHYPADVFRPGSTHPDAVAGTAMRHAYRTAARLVRDRGLPGDDEALGGP